MTQSSSFRAPTAPPGLLSSEPTGVCWINLGCLIAILNSDHYTYRQYTNRQFFFASLQTFQLAIKHFKPIYCSCDQFFSNGTPLHDSFQKNIPLKILQDIQVADFDIESAGSRFTIRAQNYSEIFNLIFSRRFSSEKCPTLTVASFFSFFFRQTTISL